MHAHLLRCFHTDALLGTHTVAAVPRALASLWQFDGHYSQRQRQPSGLDVHVLHNHTN